MKSIVWSTAMHSDEIWALKKANINDLLDSNKGFREEFSESVGQNIVRINE